MREYFGDEFIVKRSQEKELVGDPRGWVEVWKLDEMVLW